MAHEFIPPESELSDFEALLGSLTPARSRTDRDRVMFRAGQASACPQASGRRFWIAIAASLGTLALGEGALLAYRSPPKVVDRIVVVREPVAKPVSPSSEPIEPQAPAMVPIDSPPAFGRSAYERLAGQVLRFGLDGLPAPPSAAWGDAEPQSAPSRQVLQEEMRKVLNFGDAS